MIPEISEVHFPSYATLHEATVTLVDMGDRTITTQVRIDGSQRPEYGVYDQQTGAFLPMELTFKGERFVLPVREPQAAKENTSWNSLSDLTFRSWVVDEMMRYFYFQPSSLNASTAVAEKYQASVLMTLPEFVDNFRTVLRHYWPNMEIDIRLFMEDEPGYYGDTKYLVEIDHAKIWGVLLKIYEIFNVRWRIEPSETVTGGYVIKVNYDADSIDDHTFQYGYSGGLMRFERQVQNPEITNILLGRGGEKNLPYRYFKRGLDEAGNFDDSATAKWRGDPDAIYELRDINFDRLRDFNFRWYVRGWMQNRNRNKTWNNNGYSYPTYASPGSSSDYYYAFMRGCTDTKFDPVEFVSDKFEYRNSRVTALRSIEKYGEHWGALDNIDSIYPTIQGHTISPYGLIDQAVAFSPLDDDDVDTMVDNTVVEISLNQMSYHVYPSDREGFLGPPYIIRSEEFVVPTGKVAQIDAKWFSVVDQEEYSGAVSVNTVATTVTAVPVGTPSGTVPSATKDADGASIKMLPAGTYYLQVSLRLTSGLEPGVDFTGTFGMREITIKLTTANALDWAPTFNMWIKNIWDTTKGTDEHGNIIPGEQGDTDAAKQAYAERVWLPILGDHFGKEAKIGFSTGPLSISEDYDFLITELPEFDNTQNLGGVPSEWKLTLQKSQAEYDATGLFIPNSSCASSAGDNFFFLGIEIPNNYVRLAEEELTTTKSAKLSEMSDIAPTWVIGLDKVRVHTVEQADQQGQLAARLKPGARLTISDPRFTDGDLELYAQSMTYRWQEPSDNNPYLVPDIEVVLTEKPVAGSSTIAKLQGQVDAIRTEYIRADQVEEIVRRIASYLYLKKTGESDISYSPTQFSNKVTSDSFRQGGVGGTGWGIYRSNIKQMANGTTGEGDSVIEADTVIVRKDLQVNTLVVNQIEARGGKEILSAAKMEVTKVFRLYNGNYLLFFDQRQGTIENLFKKDDIVLCQRYSSDWVNTPTKYYRMIVANVRTDYVELDATTKDGDGEPAVGDVVVQYGHKTDKKRQFVIIRDVVGGGYERMISGLTASYNEDEEAWVYNDGDEYFFAGRTITDTTPRWFVGYKKPIPPQPEDEEDMDAWEAAAAQAVAQSQYIEYKDGRLTIKGSFQVTQADKSTVIEGNLIQSGEISLGNTVNNQFTIRAGVSGQYDSTQPGGGVAGWYGGQRIDRPVAIANRDAVYADPESTAEEKAAADAAVTNSAKTAFRFDGSGYLASNRIYWDANGYGGVPGITWDGTRVTVSSDLMIETLDGQYETLINAIRDIMGLFSLEYRGTANARIKALYPLYSDGWISAGGVGSGSGGGGGTAVAWGAEVANQSVVLTVDAVSKTLSLSGHTHSQYLTASALNGYATENYVTSAIAALGDAASYGVASVVSNGDTTHLPTGDAVYDAIAAAVAGIVTSNFFEEYTIQGTNDKAIRLKSAYVGLFTESGFISAGGIGSSGGSGGSSVQWSGTASGGFQELTVEGDHTHIVALQGHGHSTSESWLSSALAPYVTSTVLNTTLAYYTTLDTLANTLLGYVQKSTLASKGSASMPIYFDASSVPQEITSLDLLSKNTGYVKANRFYLSSGVYFELNNGNVHLVMDAANGKGFYVDGFVSAGGIGSGGSAGGAAQWTTPTGGVYRELTVEGSAETVALQGHGHTTSDISGLGAAATYAVASSVTQNDTTHLVTGAAVWAAIDALPEPMLFKGSLGTGGTITSLPTASGANEGWTYKVITAGTYASQAAQIGDLFISNGSAWIYIPSGDEPTGTVTSVGLSMPTGFSVSSSPITSSGTLTVAFASGYSLLTSTQISTWNAKYDKPSTGIPKTHLASDVQTSLGLADTALQSHQDISGKADKANITAGTAGTNQPTSGATIAIPYVTVNAQGIVTGYGTHSHSISAGDLNALTTTNWSSYVGTASSPVGYANQLTNSRSIWGQSFNGTGDVNGEIKVYRGGTVAEEYLSIIAGDSYVNFDFIDPYDHFGSYHFLSDGAHIMYLDGAYKRVGIGTSSPASALHVYGGRETITNTGDSWANYSLAIWAPYLSNLASPSSYGSAPFIVIGKADSAKNMGWIGYVHHTDGSNYNRLSFGLHSSDNILNITAEGKVGIGTIQPSYALDVNGLAQFRQGIYLTNPTASESWINFCDANGVHNQLDSYSGNFVFLRYASNTWYEDMKIASNGYVGINNTSPSYRLDVAGDTRTSGRYYIGTTGIFLEKDSSGNVHLGGLASGCGFYTEGFVSAGGLSSGGSAGSAVSWGASSHSAYGTETENYALLTVESVSKHVALWGHYHDDRYLKLTGGALSGNLTMNARILMGDNVLEMGNGMLGAYTPYYPNALFWYDGTGWMQVWHEGNDGAGSGLDADTVDGVQGVNFLRAKGVLQDNIDFNTLYRGMWTNVVGNGSGSTNQITSYGVLVAFGGDTGAESGSYFDAQLNFNFDGAVYTRTKNGNTWGSWRALIDNTNIGSQSVNYASSSYYATSAGSATTAANIQGYAASQLTKGFSLASITGSEAGWYRVARSETTDMVRGTTVFYIQVGGGNWNPFTTKITVHGTWSRASADVITMEGRTNFITGVRTTYEDNYVYIEVYFTQAFDFSRWVEEGFNGVASLWSWYEGALPAGGGTQVSILDTNGYASQYVTNGNIQGYNGYFSTGGFSSVGIGTNTPTYTLHVVGANTPTTPVARFQVTGSGAWQRGVQLFNANMAAGDSLMYCVGKNDDSRNMGQFYFYYAGANSTSNRLSLGLHSVDDVLNICGDGKVGIGTTSPSEKLTVSGYVSASGYKVDGLSSPGSYLLLANGSTTATNTFVWNSDIESNWQNIDSSSYSAKVPDCGALSSYISDKLAGYIPILTNHNNYVATFNTSGTLSAVYQTSGSAADINTGATTLLACASDVYDFVTGWVTSTNKTHWETAYSWVNSYGYSDYARTSQSNTFTATQNVQSVIPTSDNTYDLGSSSYRWSYIHGDCYYANRIISNNSSDYLLRFYAGSNSTLAFQVADTWSQFFGSISPGTTATYDLGSSSARWSAAYVNNVQSQNLYATQSAYIGASIYFTDYSCAFQGKTGASSYSPFFRIWTDSSTEQGDVNVGIDPGSGNTATHQLNLYGSDLNFRTGNSSDTGTTKMTISSSAIHCYVGLYSDDYISAGGIGSSSDLRLKTNLREVKLTVADIAEAPAVEFEWVKNFKTGAGSVAQYWQKYLPHNVIADANGLLTMEYGNIALLSAIKIARKVESNTEKIARLEARVKELERRLNA